MNTLEGMEHLLSLESGLAVVEVVITPGLLAGTEAAAEQEQAQTGNIEWSLATQALDFIPLAHDIHGKNFREELDAAEREVEEFTDRMKQDSDMLHLSNSALQEVRRRGQWEKWLEESILSRKQGVKG